jgi:hypothetical protein
MILCMETEFFIHWRTGLSFITFIAFMKADINIVVLLLVALVGQFALSNQFKSAFFLKTYLRSYYASDTVIFLSVVVRTHASSLDI